MHAKLDKAINFFPLKCWAELIILVIPMEEIGIY